jgi:N-methylhydantoinase A
VLNAYAQPQVIRYVDGLERLLRGVGFTNRLGVVRSDGGTMSTRSTKERPVDTAFSGPSGGVVGAAYLARRIGAPNVLTLDVGGTSTDVSICVDGAVTIKREAQLGYYQFQSRGVDVHSVGAGGGSIAYLTPVGALRVGPQSAGAEPGPAAYGRGGDQPTVTDANVVLHRIPPSTLLAGSLEIDEEAAKRVVGKVADGLGVDITQAAQAIVDIANENMHAALRVVSIERGFDPREFGLIAFGGAGPLHANAVAELMGSFPVIVPQSPGLLCALGDLVAGFRNEFAQTLIRLTEEATDAELQAILSELESRARAWMDAEGIPAESQHVEFVADMRYRGQGYEIPVPWEAGLDERFNELHEQLYGFRMPNTASEIVNLRAVGTGDRPQPELPEEEPREAMLEPGTHDRAGLHPGTIIPGPSIVTEFDSTTVILDGYVAEIDRYFNLLIRRSA